MPGQILYQANITRSYIQENRNTVFVFGDNMIRTGLGDQAAAMRGEPNAVGIPTKWSPSKHQGAYFTDDDFSHVRPVVDYEIQKLRAALAAGRDVVIPADSIGTGLAKLPERAPKIFEYIQSQLKTLEEIS